jgi:two-component system LytT family response regulator
MGEPKAKILVVDDRIDNLVALEETLRPLGQDLVMAHSGEEALRWLLADEFAVILLDVQMPGMDGFGVLAELPTDRLPLVIFVTAFDRHAIRAFEVHALDYLLKPFEYDRLRQAVRHARTQLAQGLGTAGQTRLISLLEELNNRGQSWNRLAVRDAGRVLFLQPDEIDWIEAEGNYVRLHVGKESYLLRETMSSTETRLVSKKFLRVSRSTIVNLERVTEWQPLFHGDSVVILRDGTRLTVSRVYRETLDKLVTQLR